MPRIKKQREIIDRKALARDIQVLLAEGGYAERLRPALLDCFKTALNNGRETIRKRFEEDGASGIQTVQALAFLVDQVVRTLHEFTLTEVYPVANPTKGEDLCVAATGGYGRGELAPFSDIDLLFLVPYKRPPRTEQIVEFMLYMLWDLGLKVGHATRSADENVKLAKGDLTIRTSLLEARYLSGSEQLFGDFKNRFWKDVVAVTGKDFVADKMGERDKRHDRMGDSRYVLEPNIKEGKGGLRDLQTLYWMAKYLYQVERVEDLVGKHVFTEADAKLFAKAQSFLWTVRCHLHYLAGRPEERLTFDIQKAIGERMNYKDRAGVQGVERFMKHYFLVAKDVGDLTRVLCAVMEEEHNKPRFKLPSLGRKIDTLPGFRMDAGRLNFASAAVIDDDPVKVMELFREAQKHDVDVHPDALRLVTLNLHLVNAWMRKNPRANKLFMAILTDRRNAEVGLRLLNDSGVFGRFVPDFGRVVAQMQYDMYHVYTVDEHTIRAIGILNRIEQGQLKEDHPVASHVVHEIQSRRALYVAVLLHDIAKGRGGDHSVLGAEVALKLCPRLGLTEWETEVVSWLVLEHLSMSRTAFKRDVDDPKTVGDFVDLVQSPERLKLLLSLTVVDIRAVGPNVWNAWKGGLLRDLYYRASEVMAGGLPTSLRRPRIQRAKAQLTMVLSEAGWSEQQIKTHLDRGQDRYWLSYDSERLAAHAMMIEKATETGIGVHVETRVDEGRSVTEVIIHTPDQAGLFARIAGAIAMAGATIVDAKIATLNDGMALDTFSVQNAQGKPVKSAERLKKLKRYIDEALSGALDLKPALRKLGQSPIPSRTDVFKVPPRVMVDNNGSADHTIIEINGRDRPGLLYDVTRALADLSIQVHSAHITTYGFRVIDVFYVKDIFGLKIEQEDRLRQFGKALFKAIQPLPSGEAAKPKRKRKSVKKVAVRTAAN